ncbi:MAG: helix-turn-helix domain-containing protein [FCB group bacterium]|nr:helix-turn-helix domain-containing protein [FCB group bacterium]
MIELLTAQEVADFLRVKLSTIRNWTHLQMIPHVKLRAAVRYNRSDVEEWLQKRSVVGRIKRNPY